MTLLQELHQMHDADAEEDSIVPPSLPLNARSVTTAGQTKRLSYFEVNFHSMHSFPEHW